MGITPEREEAIRLELLGILGRLSGELEVVHMFDVVSAYTKSGKNHELVGGRWVRENVPELAGLE